MINLQYKLRIIRAPTCASELIQGKAGKFRPYRVPYRAGELVGGGYPVLRFPSARDITLRAFGPRPLRFCAFWLSLSHLNFNLLAFVTLQNHANHHAERSRRISVRRAGEEGLTM